MEKSARVCGDSAAGCVMLRKACEIEGDSRNNTGCPINSEYPLSSNNSYETAVARLL